MSRAKSALHVLKLPQMHHGGQSFRFRLREAQLRLAKFARNVTRKNIRKTTKWCNVSTQLAGATLREALYKEKFASNVMTVRALWLIGTASLLLAALKNFQGKCFPLFWPSEQRQQIFAIWKVRVLSPIPIKSASTCFHVFLFAQVCGLL